MNNPFIYTFSQKWRIVFSFAVLGIVVATAVSLLIAPKYRSSTQILITQHYGQNTDIYAAAKFTEYLSNVLREVIYSKSFFDQVIYSGFGVKNDFSSVPEKWVREWKRVVVTKVISNTGIIAIHVYHVDRGQADRIANAIATIMVTKSDQYTGAGSTVSVRVIDGPSTTDKTVYPNIWLNLALGLLAGLVFGSVFIYIFPDIPVGNVLAQVNYSVPATELTPMPVATTHSQTPSQDRDFGQGGFESVLDSRANHSNPDNNLRI